MDLSILETASENYFDGTTENLAQFFAEEQNIVIFFNKKWCKPCKRIKPVIAEIAEKHYDVTFISIDMENDKMKEMFPEIKIVPSYIFYKKGKKVDFIDGVTQKTSDANFIVSIFDEILERLKQ